MRLNIISIVGILIVLYFIQAGFYDYSKRTIKTKAVILEVGEKIPVKDENRIEPRFFLPLKLKYITGGTEYIENVQFYFSNDDDISKYAVDKVIDIYLYTDNSRAISRVKGSDVSPVFIPLSYILLIAVCYYIFKN